MTTFATPTPSHPSAPNTFEADTVQALAMVRATFSQLVEAKCPGNPSVSDIADTFGIHRKLAWQVGKVAYSADPFHAAKHMPSAKSTEVWLKAAARAGCETPVVESATAAATRFHSLAATHSRTEQEFEMLLESCTRADDAAHMKWRQQSFHGNSFVWGAHCKVLLSLSVLHPSADKPHFFHIAQLRGLMGFRQTRQNVKWLVSASVVADDAAKANTGLQRMPLDPAAAGEHGGVPVIPRFCSNPMPKFSRRVVGGMTYDEFVSGPIGQTGERTLVTGEVIRNLGAAHATEHDKVAHFGASVRIPAEVFHYDMFVHRSLFGPVQRELVMFSDLNSNIAFAPSDTLPIPERVQDLGRGIGLAQTPDLPGYQELAASVFQLLGENPDEYELYRARVAYPPMPTSVMFRHPLPERAPE
ncbi:MAG TPA: hypothetical protein VD997_13230 [Phycisphaerales bacterium]|nr:hypothetical protein [Phycisphaerales bacterium]